MIDISKFASTEYDKKYFKNGVIICDPDFLFKNTERFNKTHPKDEDFISGLYCIGISAGGNKIYKWPDVRDYPDVRYFTFEEFCEYDTEYKEHTLELYNKLKDSKELEVTSDIREKELEERDKALDVWRNDPENHRRKFSWECEDDGGVFGIKGALLWSFAFNKFFDPVNITCHSEDKRIDGKTIEIRSGEICAVSIDDIRNGDKNIFNDFDYILSKSIVVPDFVGEVITMETGPESSSITTVYGKGNINFTIKHNDF